MTWPQSQGVARPRRSTEFVASLVDSGTSIPAGHFRWHWYPEQNMTKLPIQTISQALHLDVNAFQLHAVSAEGAEA